LLDALVDTSEVSQAKELVARRALKLRLHFTEFGEDLRLGVNQLAGKVGFCKDQLPEPRLQTCPDGFRVCAERPCFAVELRKTNLPLASMVSSPVAMALASTRLNCRGEGFGPTPIALTGSAARGTSRHQVS